MPTTASNSIECSSSLLAVRAAEIAAPAVPALHVIVQDASPLTAIQPTPEPAEVPATRIWTPDTLAAISKVPVSALTLPAVAPAIVKPNTAIAQAQASSQDSDTYYSDSDRDSFMVVIDNQNHLFNSRGDSAEMVAFRNQVHGNYILTGR